MEDRGYIAQALFDRLRDAGIGFCVLGDSRGYPESAPAEIEIVLPRAALEGMPRTMARFCQDFDLQLVQLERVDGQSWRFVFSWSNDIGRPRYITVTVLSDYCRGGRLLLRGEELLAASAELQFIHGLLDAVEREHLDDARAAWLAELWEQDPRGAMERVMRFWPQAADGRLIAQAARHGEWGSARAHLPRLRRALRRSVMPAPRELGARLAALARRAFQPARARIAFTGRESSLRGRVMVEVARDLAPLGLTLYEDRHGDARRADFRVVFDGPKGLESEFDDLVAIEVDRGLPAMVAETQRAILRWLECRVERRYPDATVGENPRSARLMQFLCRHGIFNLKNAVGALLNCAIECRIRSPILMPYPFGIVIERGVIIGSRVTVMQQATIGRKDAADPWAPIIEDNVFIGAGARILGPVRVGRGATVGANSVVTRDVPSHCTVVGANRLLGPGDRPPVAAQRREDHETVVNT